MDEDLFEFGLESDPLSLGVDVSLGNLEQDADPLSMVMSNLGGSSGFSQQAASLREMAAQREREAAELLQASREKNYGPSTSELFGQALAAFMPALVGRAVGGKALGAAGGQLGFDQSVAKQKEFKDDATKEQNLDIAQSKQLESEAKTLGQQAQQFEIKAGDQKFREAEAGERRAFQREMQDDRQAEAVARLIQQQNFTAAIRAMSAGNARVAHPLVVEQLAKMSGRGATELAGMSNADAELAMKNIAEQRRQAEQFLKERSESRRAETAQYERIGLKIKTPDSKYLDKVAAYRPIRDLTAVVANGQVSPTTFLVAAQRFVPGIGTDVTSMDRLGEYLAAQLRESSGESGVMTDQDFARYRPLVLRRSDETPEVYINRLQEVMRAERGKLQNSLEYRITTGLEDLEMLGPELGFQLPSVSAAAAAAAKRRGFQPSSSVTTPQPATVGSTPQSGGDSALERARAETQRLEAELAQLQGAR